MNAIFNYLVVVHKYLRSQKISKYLLFVCNMKLIGSGAHDTPLKYIWTFSFVLIFIHVYNTSKVPEEEEEEETLYM